ncbi:MAG TPA: SDR family NAD(P)-dependent oxidoreductase, partial [Spirochaetota bacterium]|nr:SDR family NAD(P)-dependent oxidoreductase [Spirochaetota bacterium]
MARTKNETALVTGGGGGIGRELCRRFHGAGYDLVIVSLLAEELAMLNKELVALDPGRRIFTMQYDLSGPDAAEAVFRFCKSNGIEVDVLVNNAGFGLAGEFAEQPLERVRQMLALNMMTMTELCHLFGRTMKERGSGRILNVSSTISFQPLPRWAAYAATKAYVSSFTQAFAREMRPHGVSVSCLYPGTTRTAFLDTAGIERSGSRWSVGSLIHGAAMDPVKVARAGFRGLMRGKGRIIPGGSNRL